MRSSTPHSSQFTSQVFAIADHDIAPGAIHVRIHLLTTLRTTGPPIQVRCIERQHGRTRHVAMRAQILDQSCKCPHGHEHSAAPFAIEYPLATHSGRYQRRDASRAQHRRGFTEHPDAIRRWIRNMDAPTEITEKVIFAGVQTHRTAAVWACHALTSAENVKRLNSSNRFRR
jgi:hypothetical protein